MQQITGDFLNQPLSAGMVKASEFTKRTEQWYANYPDKIAGAYAMYWMLLDYTHGQLVGWQSTMADVHLFTRSWRRVVFTEPSEQASRSMNGALIASSAVSIFGGGIARAATSKMIGDNVQGSSLDALEPANGPHMAPITARGIQLCQWADATVRSMRVDEGMLMRNTAMARVSLADTVFLARDGLVTESVPGAGVSRLPPQCPAGWRPPVADGAVRGRDA